MTSSTPLHDNEFIDCAKANAKNDIEAVSARCGYGDDIATFERELTKACHSIGVEIESYRDLREDEPKDEAETGVEIGPDAPDKL
jgi:hypothetical protein